MSVLSSEKFSNPSEGDILDQHYPTEHSTSMEMFSSTVSNIAAAVCTGAPKIVASATAFLLLLNFNSFECKCKVLFNFSSFKCKKNQFLILLLENSFVCLEQSEDIFNDSFYEIYLYRLNISDENVISELRHTACVKHKGISEV